MVKFISEAFLTQEFSLLGGFWLLIQCSLIHVFSFSISFWDSFGNLCLLRTLSIPKWIIRLSNFWHTIVYSLIIFFSSVRLVVTTSLPFLMSAGCIVSCLIQLKYYQLHRSFQIKFLGFVDLLHCFSMLCLIRLHFSLYYFLPLSVLGFSKGKKGCTSQENHRSNLRSGVDRWRSPRIALGIFH